MANSQLAIRNSPPYLSSTLCRAESKLIDLDVMVFRTIARKFRSIDLVVPSWLEQAILHRAAVDTTKIHLPLIAIVGPPRVGSTLMYQVLASQFELFYFDNFQHTLLRYPYLAYRLSRALLRERVGEFQSDHGYVAGLGGLSEGNFFWPYWFGMEMTETDPRPDHWRLAHIKRVFNQIHQQVGRPMVNSFNAHAFYLANLAEIFDQVVIVNMRRDPTANALSLLRARRQLCSHEATWWSIQPRECIDLHHCPVYTQIASQIIATYRIVQRQRACNHDLAIIDVAYEELCATPTAVVQRIQDYCQTHGIQLQARTDVTPLPLFATQCREPNQVDCAKFKELFANVDWATLWS
ncbi:MAG: sulfotransferase [Caldilineaceae bacterium]